MQSESQVKRTKANQDAFLATYTLTGSIRSACRAVGVSRGTHHVWVSKDTNGFKTRYAEAQEEFREALQDMAVERVKNQKPGDNPVLLITLLNAHWPEKYRRTGYLADNSAKEIMGEWKKWAKENRKHSKKRGETDDRDNAIEEAERILAKKTQRDTDEPTA
jgi:hypothetical protein